MPFVSAAQERWAFATHQPFAKEWAAMTPKNLPDRLTKKPDPKHQARMAALHKMTAKPDPKAPVGQGGRFAALEAKLADRPGVTNPAALAAAIGRRKYGAARMAKMAAAGRKG